MNHPSRMTSCLYVSPIPVQRVGALGYLAFHLRRFAEWLSPSDSLAVEVFKHPSGRGIQISPVPRAELHQAIKAIAPQLLKSTARLTHFERLDAEFERRYAQGLLDDAALSATIDLTARSQNHCLRRFSG